LLLGSLLLGSALFLSCLLLRHLASCWLTIDGRKTSVNAGSIALIELREERPQPLHGVARRLVLADRYRERQVLRAFVEHVAVGRDRAQPLGARSAERA